MFAYFFILFIIEFFGNAQSLLCYKTDDTGATVQVDNPDFKYCVFFPKHLNKNGDEINNYVDGIKVDEADLTYDSFFEQNDRFYTALAICIHEKINWPALWKWNTKRTGKTPGVEYVLRCMCKTDLCNNPIELEGNFDSFQPKSS